MSTRAMLPRMRTAAITTGVLAVAAIVPLAVGSATISKLTVAATYTGYSDDNGNGVRDWDDLLTYTFTLTTTGGTSTTEITALTSADLTIATIDAPDGMRVSGSNTTTFTVTGRAVIPTGGDAAAFAPVFDLVTDEPPAHAEQRGSVTATVVDLADPAPVTAISATASATLVELVGDTGDGLAAAGDRVDYTVAVTNDGTEPVGDVAATSDGMTGAGPALVDAGDTSAPFAVGSHTVTAAEVVGGEVPARGIDVSAMGESGAAAAASATAPAIATVTPAFALTVDATASFSDGATGDPVAWPATGDLVALSGITATNASDVPIDGFRLAGAPLACDGAATALAEGDEGVCAGSSSSPLTRADLVSGVLSLAGVTGEVRYGGAWHPAVLSLPTVPLDDATPAFGLTVTGALDDADGDGLANAGETIAYTLVVRHDSPLSLPDLLATVTDDGSDLSLGAVLPAAAAVAPGEALTVTALYEVTAADEARGSVTYAATLVPAMTGLTLDPLAAAPVAIAAGPVATGPEPEPAETDTTEAAVESAAVPAGTPETAEPTSTPSASATAAATAAGSDDATLSLTGARVGGLGALAAALVGLGTLALVAGRPRTAHVAARHVR
ncbi:hypothetical protein QQX09_04915 [Demequina sp. SYSU T00192]|uniref:DUF7507 domain-containing protein n=1 Tax=Demequina litoralis TaxID=3051660 RepID=A0ABT8G7T4_9MICO|nr:hypothetical protein [Demequina sp. SYSU T00192]MDN4475199.1 hypothetical protein [Demequina sp. SYSU T00192]